MTETPEYRELARKLLERTREGKLAWEEWGTGFKVTMPNEYQFYVNRMYSEGDTTLIFSMQDDNGKELFEVRLTDDPRTLIERNQFLQELKELYELARRKALDVDRKLDEVSGLLDSI